jgi:hypothetical protein
MSVLLYMPLWLKAWGMHRCHITSERSSRLQQHLVETSMQCWCSPHLCSTAKISAGPEMQMEVYRRAKTSGAFLAPSGGALSPFWQSGMAIRSVTKTHCIAPRFSRRFSHVSFRMTHTIRVMHCVAQYASQREHQFTGTGIGRCQGCRGNCYGVLSGHHGITNLCGRRYIYAALVSSYSTGSAQVSSCHGC